MEKRYPRTILSTPCIPWNEQYTFDEQAFRKQVRSFLDRGVNHLYLFGTAGEGYAVTDQQYKQIVTVFAEEMKGPDRYPMVGQINLSLSVMLERIETAYHLGIRDFQFSLPSWGALTDIELQSFFKILCGTFPDCRFMHYNLMRAKRVLTPDEYFQLADDFPNFVGAKYTNENPSILYKLLATPSPLQFFLGETGFAIGSMFGECGLLSSVVNSNFKLAWDMMDTSKNKDYPKLIHFFTEMTGIVNGLFAICGTDKMDGAYDKLMHRMVDPSFPIRLLPPYSAHPEEHSEKYRAFLAEKYPHWLEAGVHQQS